MTPQAASLYEKLPSVYRMRDASVGYPLRALVEAWSAQVDDLEADIARLYNNLFIETCEDWAVPYIGQLIDATILPSISGTTLSGRAQVANTLRLRRRKGTLAMIEESTSNATEWTAKACEYFPKLQTTPFLNHPTAQRVRTTDIRSPLVAERLSGPFEKGGRTIDVRRIASRRGRHNLKNIGLHLWRHRAERLVAAEAHPVPGFSGRFHLHPRQQDFPLFHVPHAEASVDGLADPVHVPEPLVRWEVYHDLRRYKETLGSGEQAHSHYFAPRDHPPTIEIWINNVRLRPEEIMVVDLAEWDWQPPNHETLSLSDGTLVNLPIRIAIDPERGRLALPSGRRANRLRVTHARGSLLPLGGGPYDRSAQIQSSLNGQTVNWQIGVGRTHSPVAGVVVATFEEAIDLWHHQPPGTTGAIVFLENSTWIPPWVRGWDITIPDRSTLLITSAQWPEHTDALGVPTGRFTGEYVPRDVRAILRSKNDRHLLTVRGDAASTNRQPGNLILNGFHLCGDISVDATRLGMVEISDVTSDPADQLRLMGTGSSAHSDFRLRLIRSLLGPLSSNLRDLSIELKESLLNGNGLPAIDAGEAILDINACTFLGEVHCRTVNASDSLFRDPLSAARRQSGCIRFSWLPFNAKTPRRYRCQPDLAYQRAGSATDKQFVLERVRPVFASLDWASPWYGMLSLRGPTEIARANEASNEVGVYAKVVQSLREHSLYLALDDALPVGLEAGHFYET